MSYFHEWSDLSFHQSDDKKRLKMRQTYIDGDQTRDQHNIETESARNGHISP